MTRRLPPFPALRGFEAAGRRESFKAAAEELSLTESAISHQVKSLESFLGVALFERSPQGVRLSEAGRAYLAAVAPLLDGLAAATAGVVGEPESGALRLRATPAFASRWLAPRLDSLAAAHPGIELEMETGIELPDFEREEIDAAIVYGAAPVAGLSVTPVLSTTRYPVCAPELLAERPRPKRPEDLLDFTLLRDLVGDDWASWMGAAGAAAPDAAAAESRGPRLAHCELTLRAAEEGQGVTLAYDVLVRRPLAEGRLLRLFETATEPKILYSLAYPAHRANRPLLGAFRDWLLGEARAQAAAGETASQAAE